MNIAIFFRSTRESIYNRHFKMKYFNLFLLCFLAVIQKTIADCVNIGPFENFNEARFMKTWYVVGSQKSSGETCRKYTFTAGAKQLNYQYTSSTGGQSTNTDGIWTSVFNRDGGRYIERFPITATMPQFVKVVSTDYDTFALILRCIEAESRVIDKYELWSTDPNGFTSANSNAIAEIPTTVKLTPLNNNCPNGFLNDIFSIFTG